jgi:hypothetical protein
MVVHNLYVHGIRFNPTEADSPLVVYSNAVLTYPIAGEGLQTVPRNRSQIGDRHGCMDLIQLSLRNSGNMLEPAAEFPTEDGLALLVPERPDHSSRILPGGV